MATSAAIFVAIKSNVEQYKNNVYRLVSTYML